MVAASKFAGRWSNHDLGIPCIQAFINLDDGLVEIAKSCNAPTNLCEAKARVVHKFLYTSRGFGDAIRLCLKATSRMWHSEI